MLPRPLWFFPLAAALVGSSALLAEDVYMKNGRVFRGVVARVDDAQVHIDMPGGTVSFPRRAVVRVEASDAAYRDYQARREALERDQAGAAAWLDLARWAKEHGLEPAAREAARAAGRLDPDTPGLRVFLADLGWVWDPATATYVELAESMARQGMVYDEGAWIPSAERDARRDRRREQEQRQAELARAEAETPASPRAAAPVEEAVATAGIPLWYAYGGGAVAPHRPHPRPPRSCPPPAVVPAPATPPAPAPPPVVTSAARSRRNPG